MAQQYGVAPGYVAVQPQGGDGGYGYQQAPGPANAYTPPHAAPVAADTLVLIGQSMDPHPQYHGQVANRPAFAHVEVNLQPGQKILAGANAMNWMDARIPVETGLNGCGTACWRQCSRESACQNTFTGPGNISFALDLPGDILPFGIAPGAGWVLSPGAWICGTDNLKVSSKFSGCAACCCGDEGPFFTHITINEEKGGNGMFYAGGYGAITRHEVPAGKTLFLDNGLFFAANEALNISLGMPGGCLGCMCGGEGLVMKITGPTVVYSQNRSPSTWKKILNQPPPAKKRQGAMGMPA
jgi:uncharacterized protein (AIM24 family)